MSWRTPYALKDGKGLLWNLEISHIPHERNSFFVTKKNFVHRQWRQQYIAYIKLYTVLRNRIVLLFP
jgi:hypothetical protein